MALQSKVKKIAQSNASKKRTEPVWRGPETDGITFSLLSRWLCCRERARLLLVEGLKPAETFNARLEFGNMWHLCEKSLAAYGGAGWEKPLREYAADLCRRFPFQQEQVQHWHDMTAAMFPEYVEHWSRHPDVIDRTPLLQEQIFDVPYQLPSGRTVRLRGKWDAVDLIGKKNDRGVYVQENKTKSSIDGNKIVRQLSFDLQTMLYVVALEEYRTECGENQEVGSNSVEWKLAANPIRGARYNVVRRPAHKSVESAMKKLGEDRDNGRIGEWFARWKVEITVADVARFRRECLDPILMQLCDWYDGIRECLDSNYDLFSVSNPVSDKHGWHWRHPAGVYNILDEGGSSDLDAYLADGSMAGLTRTDNLFPELT